MILDRKQIVYRQAGIKDIETLIDYRVMFLKEVQKDITKEKEILLRIELRKYFIKSLKDNSYITWFAEYVNQIVGLGGMVVREQPGNFLLITGKLGYILNMYTIPEFRGNGIGKEILKRLVTYGKSIRLERIDLHATPMGEPIYRKLGFKEPHDKAMELMLK
jgi:ribosomal protein S18 acetylase RimI-like enzyme